MKSIAASLLILFLCNDAFSQQQVYIPYKSKDKFGLCTEDGKLVVDTTYDAIRYLKNNYFFCMKLDAPKETLKYEYDFKKHVKGGLFQGKKLIISNEPFTDFIIEDHFIIGSQNNYRPEDCTLFNLSGQRLIDATIGRMYINSKKDVGRLYNASDKYTLITTLQRSPDRSQLLSLLVYDNKKQRIAKWLIKNATEYRVDARASGQTFTACNYYDSTGYHQSVLVFRADTFALVNKAAFSAPAKEEYGSREGDRGNYDVPVVRDIESSGLGAVEAPPPVMEEKGIMSERDTVRYYIKKKDSLFYGYPYGQVYINTPEGITNIMLGPRQSLQLQPLIYKQGNRFGLLSKGVYHKAVYDSLLYFGDSTYIAAKIVNGKLLFGIINKNEQVRVPFEYDSITGGMKQFSLEQVSNNRNGGDTYVYRLKNKYHSGIESNYAKYNLGPIMVYKNGKVGLIDMNNKTLIAPEYDMIASSPDYFNIKDVVSSFVVVQKAGRYGVLEMNTYNNNEPVKVIASPVFPNIPCYYYNDYSNKKGFRLFALYDNNTRFVGYASATGKLYYNL